ncbi:MAG TPA: hypothetical protein DDZ96_12010 [Porphyromonadaceae bacterium]|jgi:hypothetical protein|nr:hypothetical protein [Porphyromonadaceae bacterium]HBL34523.1 hypothetical protein [Porphyromonadaceae bacterium]HBX19145.1 hypothetical protein [Porphyromonadaceae bacterium]HCM22180.1 hypothetical protein [Porphyromonadaceae bacterium]
MKKMTGLSMVLAGYLLMISCGGIDSDAKKAAELTNQSIRQSVDLELEKSQKTYHKAQALIEKHKNTKTWNEFNRLYKMYRDQEKASPEP